MKHFHIFLLLTIFLPGCIGNTSKPLLKKSPYDADFNANVKRLSGKKQQEKHIVHLEAAYQSAQKADLLAADSMLNLDKPERWLYVNAYHRRLQDRQQKVLSLLPLESKNGYKPDFLTINNIAERETASRQAAAAYLHQKAAGLLEERTHVAAREAYSTLVDLKEHYYPVWENSAALLDSAAINGVEHILIEGVCKIDSWASSTWQKFYTNASDRPYFDIVISSHALDVDVSPDYSSTSYYTETKDIEIGYTEKKDTNGVVIERSPIYETVSATVTETIVEKTASGIVLIDVLDGMSGALIYATSLSANTIFSDRSIRVSGDSRALSSSVMETPGIIFTPSYWAMEDKIVDALNFDFRSFISSKLWTDK